METITRAEVLQVLRGHSLAVQASVSAAGEPQAAVVGIVVTDDFEVFFDTVASSHKAQNLRINPGIALVIGGMTSGDARTVQYQGVVDEPHGRELEELKEFYLLCFPDGRERQNWPGLIYLRSRPTWIRYSDYNQDPPLIAEFEFGSQPDAPHP